MPRRYYSSTAARTTLASGINGSATSINVVTVSGWPSSFPYTLIIDQDTVNEEIVQVTARSGTSITVVRAIDGTTGVAHSAGAAVNHGVSARDFDEPNAHIESTSNPHSVTAAQAGALALAGGTVTGPTVVDVNSASTALRITQVGAGNALVVEDSANPDASLFVVNNDGNVGIGTSSPSRALEVDGSNSTAYSPNIVTVSLRGTDTYNSGSSGAGISLSGKYNSAGAFTDLGFVSAIKEETSDGTYGGSLIFGTRNNGSGGGSMERLRITSAGRVGIGTTSPAGRLAVKVTSGYSAGEVWSERTLIVTTGDTNSSGGLGLAYDDTAGSNIACIIPGVAWKPITLSGSVISLAPDASERFRINNAGLITGSGTSLGAWTAFTPTFTGITIGNGSISAAYSVIGKTCFARYDLTFGSTTTVGGSSNGFTLPLTMKSGQYATVIPFYFDASLAASYHGFGQTTSNYIYFDATNNANGKAENITTTTPFTWSTSDRIIVSVVYEAA